MSLQSPFDTLAPRTTGQLITSVDWNALVAAASGVQDALNTLSQKLDTRLTAVENDVKQITTALQAATTRLTTLEGIVHQYSRVTLSTPQPTYVLGETAVITATVTDVAGQAVNFAPENRPWVTFVCTWGRLRAVPGFDSDGALGDRTVTVRVNQQGIAQVRLQPDHAEGFDVGFEDNVQASMNGRVAASNKSAADLIRTAATPATAKDSGAFKFLSVEYDRTDATQVRNYVDTYYQKYPQKVAGKGVVDVRQVWQDYRASVFCFVQNSNDPSAPDFGRASAATQVVFRDWISPWFNIEYAFDTTDLTKNYVDRLTPKITQDLTESVNNVKTEVNAIVANQGLLRKQRDYKVIRDALDQVHVPQPPVFLNALTQSLQNAISIQQTLQTVQSHTAELPQQEVAFEVFTTAATHADVSVASTNDQVSAVKQQLASIQQSVTDAQSKVAGLTTNLTAVGTKLDSALADSGAVGSLRLQVSTIKNQFGAFSALNPTDIVSKIGAVSDLSNRVFQLETKK
jgi:predicted  nucleic acid-binding Zn-ribbon protein